MLYRCNTDNNLTTEKNILILIKLDDFGHLVNIYNLLIKTFHLVLRRRTLYYTANLLYPCLIIAALTLLLFLQPADSYVNLLVYTRKLHTYLN